MTWAVMGDRGRTDPQPAATADLGIAGFTDGTLIGQGGFGSVYRARQSALDRVVAIKVLSIPGIRDDTRQRFERECRAIGALSGHPNIVTVYDCGLNEWGRPYIVMDHMARGSLADLVTTQGPLPWTDSVGIGIKLAGAVATAHAAGILHRDIKPENVLLSSYGEPKLGDFGISSISGEAHTTSGAITASLSHAAPELLDGDPATVRSDVYALASTLFTLLAGDPPFGRDAGESVAALIARIATSPPPDLRPRGVPDAVCAVIESCLAKDPAARIASAPELGDALRAAQEQQGVAATPMVIDPEQSLEAADAYALVDRFSPSGGGGTSRTHARQRRVLTPPPSIGAAPVPWYRKPLIAVVAILTLIAVTASAVALTRERDPVTPQAASTPAPSETVADVPAENANEKKKPTRKKRKPRRQRNHGGDTTGGVTGSFAAPSGSFASSGSGTSGSAPSSGGSQGSGSGSGGGGDGGNEKPPPPPPPPPPDDMLFLLKNRRTGHFYLTLSSADAHMKADAKDSPWNLMNVGYVYEAPLEGKNMNELNLDDGDTAYVLNDYSEVTGSTSRLYYAANSEDHIFTTNFNQAATVGTPHEAGWVRAP